jgi:hypothetical protein
LENNLYEGIQDPNAGESGSTRSMLKMIASEQSTKTEFNGGSQ